jgi:hypothetical protein
MPYPISDLEKFAPGVTALKSIGIRTTKGLIEAAKNPKGRKLLSAKTGLEERRILRWANMADRMRIKGVGEDYAHLLEVVGVNTVKELRYRSPAKLAKAMADINTKRKLVLLLPSEGTVLRWIEHAKKLPLKITY